MVFEIPYSIVKSENNLCLCWETAVSFMFFSYMWSRSVALNTRSSDNLIKYNEKIFNPRRKRFTQILKRFGRIFETNSPLPFFQNYFLGLNPIPQRSKIFSWLRF